MRASRQERAAIVALLRALPKGQSWTSVTERVSVSGSALRVWQEPDMDALVPDPERASILEQAQQDVATWEDRGWQLITVLDADYPVYLRGVFQAPPVLFAVGHLRPDDAAVAVVGSRKASSSGLRFAEAVASLLAADGVTVLSGLAEGIDTAAHRAALDAGGRTVAVIGTGIAQHYPASNKALRRCIEERGLVVSQFWPDAPPRPQHFIMRNAVMSGYGHATVVVEAGEHSGARAQARMAVEHGRPVILSRTVVGRNEWAQQLRHRPSVYVANTPDEVMHYVREVFNRGTELDEILAGLSGSCL